jgi:hypothetical protein
MLRVAFGSSVFVIQSIALLLSNFARGDVLIGELRDNVSLSNSVTAPSDY